MTESSSHEREQCPTPTAHRRLDEAHRFWHECLTEYQSPEGFRVKLNACIQALRNVTFVLQKEKHRIEDFDEWYRPWQDRMRSDPILQWIIKSRNRIVKEGDLETESIAKATLIWDYYSAAKLTAASLPTIPAGNAEQGNKQQVNAPPRYRIEQIVKMVIDSGMPRSLLYESALTIERRWVDRALPDQELLDALATAYARLSDVVADAHVRAGMNYSVMVHSATGDVQVGPHPGWYGRLPCMVTTLDARTISVLLKDGTVNDHGRSWRLEYDSRTVEQAVKRYGKIERNAESWHSSLDAVPFVMDIARRILRSGEEHGWFMFYFCGGEIRDTQVLAAQDMAGKRKLAQEAADHAARNGFDSVLMVSEMWVAPMELDKKGAPIRPSTHGEREEGLGIFAETSDGRRRTIMIPFERKRRLKKTVMIGEPVDASDQMPHNFFAPLRAVWQRWPRAEDDG